MNYEQFRRSERRKPALLRLIDAIRWPFDRIGELIEMRRAFGGPSRRGSWRIKARFGVGPRQSEDK